MPARNRKPVVHGRDHAPGGSDPIPGGLGHTIQDETVSLPQQALLNFTGAGVTASDNPATGATDVTIPGGGGGSVDLHHPRFISCENELPLPSGGYKVPFPLGHIVTNDYPPITAGYDKAAGYYLSAAPANWVGDNFTNAAATGDAFQIKRIGGIYMLFASAYIYSATPITVVFSVAIPNAGGIQAYGIPGFARDQYYNETVKFDASQDRIHWARTFMFVNRTTQGGADTETAEPVALWVQQTTGATLDLGPPSFGLGAVRLNMYGAYPPP